MDQIMKSDTLKIYLVLLANCHFRQGCYEVPFGTTFKVDRLGIFDCHTLCAKAEYVSIKNDQCVCIHDVISLTRVKDYKPCNCCNCFQIRKRIDNNDIFMKDDGEKESTQNPRCMAAHCAGMEYRLTHEQCNTSYAVLCDNGIRFTGLSQTTAAESCKKIGSFIKWIPESICSNKDNDIYRQQHWTSAITSSDDFKHVFRDNIDILNPITCYVRYKDNTDIFADDCHKNFSFFCRIDTDAVEVQGQLTSFSSCDNMASSGVNSGAIAGSVVAVLIIIIVVLAGLFLYKRRKDNKIPNMRNLQGNNKLSTQIQQTTSFREKSVHDYHEINLNQSQDESQSAYSQIGDDQFINEPSKSRYSFTRPIINGKCTPANVNTIGKYTNGDSDTSEIRQQRIITAYPSSADTTGDHYDKTNKNQLCHDQAKADIFGRQNLNFEINEKEGEDLQYLKSSAVNPVQNANYSLAKPVRDSEEIDPYSDNQDYDKLNNVKKKDDTNTQCKVYDHLPTTEEADPTYDHSVINSPKVHDNNYDHFTFDDDNI